jgi:hypothetical protein
VHDPIISEFSSKYWTRGITGAVIALFTTGRYLFILLSGHAAQPLYLALLDLLFVGVTVIYFYFFSRGWKRIQVTDDGIIVDYMLSKKREIIPYANIRSIATYRDQGTVNGRIFAQDLVLEYEGGTLRINGAVYDNYNRIKAQIYNYKYGFDRVRSRY